jgi:hypothetical protein
MLTPTQVTPKCTDENLPGTPLQAGYLLQYSFPLSSRMLPPVYASRPIVDPQNQLKHG